MGLFDFAPLLALVRTCFAGGIGTRGFAFDKAGLIINFDQRFHIEIFLT